MEQVRAVTDQKANQAELLRPETLVTSAAVMPLPPGCFPPRIPLSSERVQLEPLHPDRHASELFAASHADEDSRRVWAYLPKGPFPDEGRFVLWLRDAAAAADQVPYAIRDIRSGYASGMARYMRIEPAHGVLEIGGIWLAPSLQRTRAASEALVLLLRHAFDALGYRRIEWKCNALNTSSRRAALRLGFRFEGIFYRHMVINGRNRDTAWYSLLAEEWPARRDAFDRWLAADNFDDEDRQRRPLERTDTIDAACLTAAGSSP